MSELLESDSPKRVLVESYSGSKSLTWYTKTQKLNVATKVEAYTIGETLKKRPSLDYFDQTLSGEVLVKLDEKEDNDNTRN